MKNEAIINQKQQNKHAEPLVKYITSHYRVLNWSFSWIGLSLQNLTPVSFTYVNTAIHEHYTS